MEWKKNIIELFPDQSDYLINFLEIIPLKSINPFLLDSNFQEYINKISSFTPILFVFDVEFQNIDKKQEKHILEFGGIIFVKKNSHWYYLGNFHFNLPPITSIDKLGLIQSQYTTISSETRKQIEELEKEYLYANQLNSDQSNFEKLYYQFINSPLSKKKNIPYIDPKPENYKKIIKSFKNMSFQLRRKDIGSKVFDKVWQLYLNDTYVIERTININNKWLKAFIDILTNSTLLVKGNQDIIAINNLLKKYKFKPINDNLFIFDIAIFNESLRKLCNSAELEKTYWCLLEHNLVTNIISETIKKIFSNLVIKDKVLAHNPLVDAYFTFVVGITVITRLNI